MPELHIQLLGEFRLTSDDALVSTVNAPRLQALLAYLVLHRHAPQPRQHLAFLLWPDTTEAQARTNLRHLLHSCYDDWIVPERERLRQACTAALERLLLLLERASQPREAIAYAQRLLRHDPLREETYRAL